jgi:nitrogen regulatory protein PII
MTKVETILPDSAVNPIVDDISNKLNLGKEEPHDMIFIRDIFHVYRKQTKEISYINH